MPHPSEIKVSARDQQEQVWQKLKDSSSSALASVGREWPSSNDVLQDVRKTDYNEILRCPADIHPLAEGRDKTICPQGAVCCQDGTVSISRGLQRPSLRRFANTRKHDRTLYCAAFFSSATDGY
jgi:hypothetical protein